MQTQDSSEDRAESRLGTRVGTLHAFSTPGNENLAGGTSMDLRRLGLITALTVGLVAPVPAQQAGSTER